MKKFSQYLLILLFLGFIVTAGIHVQFSEDFAASYYENRALAQRPEPTMSTIMDGSFTKEYDLFFTDQFPVRDKWVQGYLNWQKLTQQTFLFDYYLSDDQWIYPKPMSYFARMDMDKSLASLKELTSYANDHEIELYFFSLPERRIMLEAPYPAYARSDYEQMNKNYFIEGLPKEGLTFVNLAAMLREKFPSQADLKQLYFQTDHHWNVDGAFEGYKMIYHVLNQHSRHFKEPAFDSKIFEKECFPNETFMGSYNKQLYGEVDTSDVPCTMTPTKFNYNDLDVYAGEIRADLKVPYQQIYSPDVNKNAKMVEYSGVFTGDHREINIINPFKTEEGTKVLFIKDSYANPLTLWLAQHFYQTTFYDLRYNTDRTLYQYLEQNDYDMIAFLYNDLTIFPGMYEFD